MEIKSQLMSEDSGKDFTSVQNLQKKHALLETNIMSYQDRVDVEDEEAGIRKKEPIIASTNRGRDLIGFQNLIKEHQAMQGATTMSPDLTLSRRPPRGWWRTVTLPPTGSRPGLDSYPTTGTS